MNTTETHAMDNAKGWIESIKEAMKALGAAQSTGETVEYDGEQLGADELIERIEQMPLSVEVRSEWYAPGTEYGRRVDPAEYCILLTTGGPALRLIGKLDGGLPQSARLEYQDWGVPWTNCPVNSETANILLEFASCFYFGE